MGMILKIIDGLTGKTELRQRIMDLEKSLAKACDPTMIDFHATAKQMELEVQHWSAKMLVYNFAEMFEQAGATRILELKVQHPEQGPFLVTIVKQWAEPTPAQLITQLKARVAELENQPATKETEQCLPKS